MNIGLRAIGEWLINSGMPIVACYQIFCSNIFLNTAYDEATGLEHCGNLALAPFQYLFAGNTVSYVQEGGLARFELSQRFDYNELLVLKSAGSAASLPVSIVVGGLLKGLAYLSPEVRQRHTAIKSSIASTDIRSKSSYYSSLGIDLCEDKQRERFIPLGLARHPGSESSLYEDKALLKEIIALFEEKGVIYWVDCGTCLGVYRYGGSIPWDNDIDIAILQPDFNNVRHVLRSLDSSKYLVQDWSHRERPETYLRVYIRKTGHMIDIYHFGIDEEQQVVRAIISNEVSFFLPEDWKRDQSRYKVATPYSVIFPLKVANYDGIDVMVPSQIERYLKDRYGEDLSPSNIYNETTGQYEKVLDHPYWQSFISN